MLMRWFCANTTYPFEKKAVSTPSIVSAMNLY